MTRTKYPVPDAKHCIEVRKAQKEDVEAIVEAIVAAYEFDPIWIIARDFVPFIKEEMLKGIREAFDKPQAEFWKAVDSRYRNTIVGVALWARWDGSENIDLGKLLAPPLSTQTDAEPLDRLFKEIVAGTSAARKKWIVGKKCWFLQQLAVVPEYQRKGVGTALCLQGIRQADKEGTVSWLEASPAGHHLYSNYGYNDVGVLTLDLSDYSGKGRGWGVYENKFMLRLPHLVQDTT